ncbi:hypothetical protein D3C78_1933000 [compost metagenome]
MPDDRGADLDRVACGIVDLDGLDVVVLQATRDLGNPVQRVRPTEAVLLVRADV